MRQVVKYTWIIYISVPAIEYIVYIIMLLVLITQSRAKIANEYDLFWM